ncbi:MAG: hypothetical protein Q4G13_04115 [Moraxella sp.]|nr:hypothetical protein [Moraxella sp.]
MKFVSFYAAALCVLLVGCDKPASDSTATQTSHAAQTNAITDFVGCYTTTKDTPALIKVNYQEGNWSMQMKEPSKSTPWDNPEPLSVISVDEGWQYFAVNAIGLDKANVTHMLARPDRIMVLARLDSAAKNINPQLDSDFVAYIFQGSNTIYQVACDDTPMDIIKDGEQTMKQLHGGV